jgi:uncharacterized protein involved in exopolysaccharide biosynthesis
MSERSPDDRARTEINGIGLDSYIATVLRYRWLIVGVALAGAVTGLVLALSRTPLFEARATVVVNRPTAGEAPVASQVLRTLFVNQGVAAQALSETGLDQPPYSIDAATFLRDHLWLDDVVPGSMLQVRVRLRDPELAVKACSRLVGLAIDRNAQISAEEGLAGQEFIKQQLDSSRERLDELESRLLTFKTQAQLDVQREDVQARLEGRRELIDLEIRLAAERGRLAAAETELARRSAPPGTGRGTVSLGTTPESASSPNVAAAHDAAKHAGDRTRRSRETLPRSTDDETSVSGAGHQDGLPDDTYEILGAEAATSRLQLAGLESRRKALVEKLGLARPALAQLTELYKRELEEARLQAAYEVSAKIYRDLLTRYEQVRIQVGSRSTAMKLVDPALTATQISRPMASIATFLGAAAATGAAILLAFVLEFLRTGRVARSSPTSHQ